MSEQVPVTVTDVLGKELPVIRSWPDGSWECPHCGYGYAPSRGLCRGKATGYRTDCSASSNHCQNPACLANPHYPVEDACKRVQEAARREAEDQARQRNHEAMMRRIKEGNQARANAMTKIREEAVSRGACIRCALKDAPYRVKFIKHRTVCPMERK